LSDWNTISEEEKYVKGRPIKADAGTVIQSAIDALTSGGTIFLKEIQLPPVTYGDNILIIEECQGERKVYSNKGKWRIPTLSTNPDTTGWATAEAGRHWYNESLKKICFWDGTTIQTLPSAVGAGVYKLAPSFTIYTDGTDTYAMDEDGNVVYGGPGDAGGIDGANASAVIQAALDALTNGGTILIKTGTYTLNAKVTIKHSKISLVGEDGTVLYCPFAGDKIYVNGGLTDVRISNLTVDCASQSGNAIYVAGDSLNHVLRLTIDYMKIFNAYPLNGIDATWTYESKYLFNHIEDCDGGLAVAHGGQNNIILGNILKDNTHGFLFEDGDGSIIVGNINMGGGHGFQMFSMNECVLADNISWEGENNGIYLLSSHNNLISNNKLYGNWRGGILIEDSNRNLIQGNVLRNNTSGGLLYIYEIRLTGYSSYNIVRNNYIFVDHETWRADYGIEEEPGATTDYNIIEENYIEGVDVSGVRTIGANTKVRRNIGYVTENSGTGTFTSGSQQAWVAHGLSTISNARFYIQGHHSEVRNIIVDPANVNASQFRCDLEAPVTADRTFWWRAIVE